MLIKIATRTKSMADLGCELFSAQFVAFHKISTGTTKNPHGKTPTVVVPITNGTRCNTCQAMPAARRTWMVDSLPCAAKSQAAITKPKVNMYPMTTAIPAAIALAIKGG